MNLFHETYGIYFRVVQRLLEQEVIQESDINHIIFEEAFQDSLLFLPQKLIPQKDGSDWGMLHRNTDNTLSPVTQHQPPKIVTTIQKRWLKATLDDPKMRLFLSDDTFSALEKRLSDVEPLYHREKFCYFDRFADGDNMIEESYRIHFQQLLKAIHTQQLLRITYTSRKKESICGIFQPIQLEYSRKNDKLRVHCRNFENKLPKGNSIINLGRITAIQPCDIVKYSYSITTYFQERRCHVPVKVLVKNERNATNRFLMEFASFEKRTERDIKSGTCCVWLYYDKQDETEMLIRLLGFGSVIEILEPEEFRQKAAKRVQIQYELLFNKNES